MSDNDDPRAERQRGRADRRFRRAYVPFMELTGRNCHKNDLAIIVGQAHNDF
jgi:hypothetical protein